MTSRHAHRALLTTVALLITLLAPTIAHATDDETFTPMQFGDRGWHIRVLQSRLHQLDLHSEVITGRFDAETRTGVRTFESRREGWKVDGIVDERMWTALVNRTEKPTQDALRNIYQPGPALLSRGDTGRWVRVVQARLKQLKRYSGDVTGRYLRTTVGAVKAFQTAQRIPVTGQVDRRTLDRLVSATRTPTRAELFNIVPPGARLDPRCTTGRAMCIDKTSRSLRWVVNGVVLKTMDVRFGSDQLPTREGAFSVFRKSRDHVSSLYHTSMPFAMFFSGGQAVHYSPDFAAVGYNGASHGCVNVRDRAAVAWLFDQVRIGDKVIVYRS
jgi:peptidoglycan hydrolase-like protein with peptidoglycan-binding domain